MNEKSGERKREREGEEEGEGERLREMLKSHFQNNTGRLFFICFIFQV